MANLTSASRPGGQNPMTPCVSQTEPPTQFEGRDLSAIINGLTLEHSSGAAEGNVTRVKLLKRDGYGRANFDLLRAQILAAA